MAQQTNAELELANAKIAELQARLGVYQRQEETLIPLPNGDLHRGFRKFSRGDSNIDVEKIPESFGNPLDRAMAKILAHKRIDQSHLECVWCGLQFSGMGSEKDIREHLKQDHPSVVEGYDKIVPEVLMANLAEANAELAKRK
jgi:hypothetical protein